MLFADKEYPANMAGGKSFLYPANSVSLGDNILMTMISQALLKDNPDEAISLLPFSYDIVDLAEQEKPDKVFLRMDATCVTSDEVERLKELTRVFEFELHRECHDLWKQGVFPDFRFTNDDFRMITDLPERMLISKSVNRRLAVQSGSVIYKHDSWYLGAKYVVFHIRNIQTIKGKNTDPLLVERILRHFIFDYSIYDLDFVVLLGNDNSYGREVEYLGYDKVVDFRKKLTLDEIFKVIQHSKLFIGSDSGIAHLAGCCNVPMICWGFENEYWFPKVRNIEECCFLTKEETKAEVILREISRRLDA